VEADLKTENLSGKVQKLITVRANDPNQQSVSLRIGATVLRVVDFLPNDRAVLQLNADGPTVREFPIRVHDREPVEVSHVQSNSPHTIATIRPLPRSGPTSATHALVLTIDKTAPPGRFEVEALIQTTSPREPEAKLHVVCEKGIIASPPSVFVGNVFVKGAAIQPTRRFVTLTKARGTFHIRDIQSDDPNLVVAQEAVNEGASYRLSVVPRDGVASETINGKITVFTDDPHQPAIEIPVRGRRALAKSATPSSLGSSTTAAQ
jgi:hypothetical protein